MTTGPLTLIDRTDAVRRMPAGDGVATLLTAARREVVSMCSLSPASSPLRQLRPRPGLRYRAIFPDSARTTPALCGWLGRLSVAGVDIRTLPEVPMDAVVVDGSAAAMPADGSGTSVVVLQLPGLVAAASELFERVWPTAVPLAGSEVGRGEGGLSERERQMLQLLALGATDEAAAAELGVSVRTVRRMVATLMHRLGARSRFQAGAKAADRGWLLDQAS